MIMFKRNIFSAFLLLVPDAAWDTFFFFTVVTSSLVLSGINQGSDFFFHPGMVLTQKGNREMLRGGRQVLPFLLPQRRQRELS